MSDASLYIIEKGRRGKWSRITLLWSAMKGVRALYLGGLVALLFEAFFTFASPMVIKLTIDSVLGQSAPSIPAPLDRLGETLLGPGYQGGGLFPLPEGAEAAGQAGGEWAWRPFLRDHLWTLGLAFLGFIGLQAFFGFLAGWSSNKAAETAARNMRNRLYQHMLDLPYEAQLRAQTGDWMQRCTSDIDTTRRFMSFEIFEIVRTLFLVSIAFPVMLALSPGLTAWGSLVIPVILAFSVVFHHFVHKAFMAMDEREGVLTGIVQENVTGVRVVRAFARQLFEQDRFAVANKDFRNTTFKVIFWLAIYWGTSSFLGLFQIAVVLGAGMGMLLAGQITLGLLVLFMTYEQQVLWPIRQFGRLIADMGKARVALGRMAELLHLPLEEGLDKGEVPVDDSSACPGGDCPCDIVFEDVSFSYPDGTEVLHHVNLSFRAGEQTAILGPTGSGKSTLVHLLIRLYEPTSGRILLGGRDIRAIPKLLLRRTLAMVLQEGFLFGRTIRENIRLARSEAQEAEILEAARSAALGHVIEEFNEGYETMVGERGVTLSGGQRQRLALARSLVRGTDWLILDDSLSAVDTETDAMIRSALAKRERQVSTIIIAHRLTTLASADHIVVLEHGRVTAEGTHRELVNQPGLYQRLNELQNSLSEEESTTAAPGVA